MKQHKPLVLASQSPARQQILRAAGLEFQIRVSSVDESAEKRAMSAAPVLGAALADYLAILKATRVSADISDTMTIGADQTLECGGALFDKPADMAQARHHLRQMSGKTHSLNSAVAVACNGLTLWRHQAVAHLTMRTLSQDDINTYLETAGSKVLSSVGCYQLEDAGARLFDTIEGDYFSILGLPLLPLLSYLRAAGVID